MYEQIPHRRPETGLNVALRLAALFNQSNGPTQKQYNDRIMKQFVRDRLGHKQDDNSVTPAADEQAHQSLEARRQSEFRHLRARFR